MQVVVTTQTLLDREIAVCPVLNLEWVRTRKAGETDDLTRKLYYSDNADPCDTLVKNNVELSACTWRDDLDAARLPVSFSRTRGLDTCSAVTKDDDRFKAKPVQLCGANQVTGTIVQEFEISKGEINDALLDPSLEYDDSRFDIPFVQSVEVFVFEDFVTPMGNGVFTCPSGINTVLDQSNPLVATVRRFLFLPGQTPNITVDYRP